MQIASHGDIKVHSKQKTKHQFTLTFKRCLHVLFYERNVHCSLCDTHHTCKPSNTTSAFYEDTHECEIYLKITWQLCMKCMHIMFNCELLVWFSYRMTFHALYMLLVENIPTRSVLFDTLGTYGFKA